MKKNMILGGLVVLALVQTATATLVVSQDWTVNQVLPDNNPAGYAAAQGFTGLDAGAITQVDVRLNLSGGYNGDLYGYLVLQSLDGSTTSAILLNRIGLDETHPFGNSGAGINVTLSGSGAGDIHAAAFGPVSGIYTPDGNAAALDVFSGHNANGTWTLFLADLSGGDRSTLVSWGLDITVVPEPATWALLIFGIGLGVVAVGRQMRRAAI